MNRHAKSTDVMVSWAGINIAYLVSQSTMICYNSENLVLVWEKNLE